MKYPDVIGRVAGIGNKSDRIELKRIERNRVGSKRIESNRIELDRIERRVGGGGGNGDGGLREWGGRGSGCAGKAAR